MICLSLDPTAKLATTQVIVGEHSSSRRYNLANLTPEQWNELVDLVTLAEQAGWIFDDYERQLRYLKQQMVGKIIHASVYMVLGGIFDDMKLIEDCTLIVG